LLGGACTPLQAIVDHVYVVDGRPADPRSCVADPRFAKTYDAVGPGLVCYLREAVLAMYR
jgi:hypothetical protein